MRSGPAAAARLPPALALFPPAVAGGQSYGQPPHRQGWNGESGVPAACGKRSFSSCWAELTHLSFSPILVPVEAIDEL
ncbi:hypothetical protein E2562_033263 [Oryza meyeriana var. granulata]|uniref:Uncharacterized protein n=1 Tax=Oryza meyeriana var. granulata TaxID=110450 RepID=A0A6G1CXN8_9ORYZ|nr:hypothetical protein E2562_033263 [Oryza meyeriana var. granulata]